VYAINYKSVVNGRSASVEQSDEESLFFLASNAERFLASLGMTTGKAFFRKLSSWA
jgi:hypothetical protein